jgi:hypothetical protein
MKRTLTKAAVIVLSLSIFPFLSGSSANAANPTIYESLSGTNATNINSTGSSDSVGFSGNWSTVNAYKNPYMVGVAAIYRNTYNSYLKFPTNTRFTVPSGNTAASSVENTWNVHYSARQISSGVNFDANGNFYLSFLTYSPNPGGNWGSAVVGLLNGLPTSVSDTSKNAIFMGRPYSGAPTIHLTTANVAVWNQTPYTASGTANNPAAADGNSWFVIAKLTTATSGNDTIQLKFYASTDTVPAVDSGITWDVSYSTPITGTYSYLSVQTEYNGTIDELRGGPTYDAVSGVATSTTIGTPTISGSVNKGISSNVTLTVGASGYVRFFVDGKRIPGCLKTATTGSSPNFTATCAWKPPVKGLHRIHAAFTSTDAGYLSATSPTASVQVLPRTSAR